jgi:UDP-galactopyranose mutase
VILVVGAGMTGATIARLLVDAGKKVEVIDERSHLGGNCHDELHADTGYELHTYGPHYFRTNSERIWTFVNRFAEWDPWEAMVFCAVGDRTYNWPLRPSEMQAFGEVQPPAEVRNFKDACLKHMPLAAYATFVDGYNRKQWGIDPAELTPGLAGRIDRGDEFDVRLKQHKWQALPRGGYRSYFARLLHGIPVHLNTSYSIADWERAERVVYTGSIDALYGYRHGRLPYRAQSRQVISLRESRFQSAPQVNYPSMDDGDLIRIIEWSQVGARRPGRGTLLTVETPTDAGDHNREYPVPIPQTLEIYEKYRECAKQDARHVVCGRLGEYRYLDMDQAIGRAMRIASEIEV